MSKIDKNRLRKLNKFGRMPINARITIDYSKEKPKVTFGYIAQKDQRDLVYANPISMLLTIITLGILIYFLQFSPHREKQPIAGACEIYEQYSPNDNHVSAYNISCGNFSYFLEYRTGYGYYPLGQFEGFYMDNSDNWMIHFTDYINSQPSYLKWFLNLLFVIFMLGLVLGSMFIILGMAYVYGWFLQKIPILNKKVNKWIPELNKKLTHPRYQYTFRECPPEKRLEIPLFKNVFLDYEATKEFSKYLQRVEIREHPFSRLVRQKRKNKKKNRKKKKYDKKRNIMLWKATFIFKEVPKTGRLDVRWA